MKLLNNFGWMMAITLAFTSAVPLTAQGTAPKLGYINSQKIIAQAPEAVKARQQIESELSPSVDSLKPIETQLEALQKELQSMLTEGQRFAQDFERQAATLTADARQQREQQLAQKREVFGTKQAEYQQILTNYQDRRTQVQQRAQQREEQLMAPVMKRISEVLEQIRTEGNYVMVFDIAGGTMLVAADPSLDLTDRVLERLGVAPKAGQ